MGIHTIVTTRRGCAGRKKEIMRYEITTKNYDLEKNSSKNRIVADTDNLVAYGREDLIDKLRFLKRFKIKVIAVHKVRMKDSTYTDVSEKYLIKPELSYYGYNEVSKNHPGYRDRNGN